jgi:hypothetical protein
MIRASGRSALSLARELGVSDTRLRRVRNGELWKVGSEDRNRSDVPRRVIVETLSSPACGSLSSAAWKPITWTSPLAGFGSRGWRRRPTLVNG